MKVFVASLCLLLLLGHSCNGDKDFEGAMEDTEQNEVDTTMAPLAAEEDVMIASPPTHDTLVQEDSQAASSQMSLHPLPARGHPPRSHNPQTGHPSRPLGPRVTFAYQYSPPASHRQLRHPQRMYGVPPQPPAPQTLYSTHRLSHPHFPAVSERAVPFRGSVRPHGASSNLPGNPVPSEPLPNPHTSLSLPSRPFTPSSPLPPPSTPASAPFPPPLLPPRLVTPTTPDDSFISQVDIRSPWELPSNTFPLDPTGALSDPSLQVDNANDLGNPALTHDLITNPRNLFTNPRNLFYDPRNYVYPNVALTNLNNPRVALPAQGNAFLQTHDLRPSNAFVSPAVVNQNRPSFTNLDVVNRIVNQPPLTNQESVSQGDVRTFVNRDESFVNPLTTPVVGRDGTVINQGVPSLANLYRHFTNRDRSFESPVAPLAEDFVNQENPFVNQDVQSLDNPFIDRATVLANQGVMSPCSRHSPAPVTPSHGLNEVLVRPSFPQYAPFPLNPGGYYGNYYRRSYNYGGLY